MNDSSIDISFLRRLPPAAVLRPAGRAAHNDRVMLRLSYQGVLNVRYHAEGSAFPFDEQRGLVVTWSLPLNLRAGELLAWVEAHLGLFSAIHAEHQQMWALKQGETPVPLGWFGAGAHEAYNALLVLARDLERANAAVMTRSAPELLGAAGGPADEALVELDDQQFIEDAAVWEERWYAERDRISRRPERRRAVSSEPGRLEGGGGGTSARRVVRWRA